MRKHFAQFVMIILILIIFAIPVHAHKMLIDPIEEGKIQVVYEDGSHSNRTIVYAYDDEGNEVANGSLDENGYFYYEPNEATFFVADDGIGHRTEWRVGEEILVKSDPHRWITVGIVVAIFISIAVFFSYRSKRKAARA
ncbi:hypothetical protein [Alkalihalobacterium elongatum]|uniref:hypothetical protein n=1 Tax=Alkalihalobacterium elongatum TaxID=2675466 RepID=UPI001C1F8180|nr:hypothetical protein [Alkalihalobacterium elongatum]